MVRNRPGRRIGVFGGTFDPIHIGHLVAAVDTRDALELDVVLLVVAGEPWQKAGTRDISPAADRLAMVVAAVEGLDGVEASDIEVQREGPSYTADTLASLADAEPGADLHLILGTDAAALFDTWERHDEVAARAHLVVVERPGTGVPDDSRAWTRVPIPALDVSSTELRARVRAGRSVRFLVPPGAEAVLGARGLYR